MQALNKHSLTKPEPEAEPPTYPDLAAALARMEATVRRKHKPYFDTEPKTKAVRQPMKDP